ncbi:di-heme oxidoreductase family protein [Aquimarina pacifica]|uniref:di-heme oxidoreductase family protein n=1 Tax=Aquimarina pacifica TaxID=1296415 RepID=UPI00126897A5|nr:di-heme oxidoredictase family protein [Aquimarina pacifica]
MKLDTLLIKYMVVAVMGVFIVSCESDDTEYTLLTPEDGEAFSGGETTVFDISQNAFGFQAPNLDTENGLFFFTGNSLFNQNWVTAPASTTARDGLGPLFNARSCSGCHFKDGRGRAPITDGELSSGLLFRLSIPGTDEFGANLPDPNYGGQLQDDSILGLDTEGHVTIDYEQVVVTYPDGNSVTLQKPLYTFENLSYGSLAASIQISPRVANQMIGLGLLDAIPEATLLGFADISDSNGDGISGKPNYVYDVETQSLKLGRFGWKSNQPTLKQQVAGAFLGDMGITSSLFLEENCPPTIDCNTISNGGSPEISDENLDKVALYSATLGVPGRRNHEDQSILQGKELFEQVNCIACHIPKMETGSYHIEALENQTIRPYTDLLLHDMGEGLADNTPDFEATGKEWRTAPLWGIGLIETVNGHTNLLHDGRARNIEEAILWHDGEAASSKTAFMNLIVEDRTKLIDFIKSL